MAKMSAEDRKKFIAERLAEQRHPLRAAVNSMGEGDLTQALHVATIIRTLVHEIASTKPLLKYINPNYLETPISDRVMEASNEDGSTVKSITFTCPISAEVSGDPP